MLPSNFTFHIAGRYELKYLVKKSINYFIGFNHPGQLESEKYTYDNVSAILGEIKYFSTHEVHDAYNDKHIEMGCKMPDKVLIQEIINSAVAIKEMLNNGERIHLAVCCQAGISRSTATTYIILCYLLGEWNEREAFNYLMQSRDIARPNPLMVGLADKLMRRKGKMIAPIKNAVDFCRDRKDDDGILLF